MKTPRPGIVSLGSTFAFVAGAILFGVTVWQVGPKQILGALRDGGFWLLPLFTISLGWKCWNTLSWIVALPEETRHPGFWTLFRANLAGDVLNNLLPSANIGGEFAKPYFLRGRMSMAASAAGVMANKTVEILSGVVFVSVGAFVAIDVLPFEASLRMGLMVVITIWLLGTIGVILAQRHRPVTKLLNVLNHLGLTLGGRSHLRGAAERVDEGLSTFISLRGKRFWTCLGLRFISLAMGYAETFAILRLIGVADAVLVGFLLFSLGMVIDAVFFFVPGSLGMMEAGNAYLFLLLGLNPGVGLSVGIVKRVRKLAWMAIGAVALYAPKPDERPDSVVLSG